MSSKEKKILRRFCLGMIVFILLTTSGCGSFGFQRDLSQISLDDAWDTACDITYKSEGPGHDYWQAPEETLMLGTGDCEDKSLLLWYTLRHVHNIKTARLVIGLTHVLFKASPHAWVEVGDGLGTVIMDPTAKQAIPRYMLSGLSYVRIEHAVLDRRAMAFMRATGYRNLNPKIGWK